MSKATDTSGCGTNGRALPPAAPLPPPNVRGTSYGDMLAAAGLDSTASDTAATPRSPMRGSLKKDALLRLQPAPGLNPELSLKTIASFGAPEFGLNVANAVQGPQVLTLYTDVLGLPLGTFTVAAAVAKSVDLICGFGLGYATDTLRSRFGRRRPFIVLGAILTALGSVGITHPPAGLSLRQPDRADHAAVHTHSCSDIAHAHNCSATAHCLSSAVAHHTLPSWDTPSFSEAAPLSSPTDGSSAASEALPVAPLGLAIWLFVTFLCRAIGERSIFGLAYDALGMELSSVYDERSRLFGGRAFSSMAGIVLGTIVFLALSITSPGHFTRTIFTISVVGISLFIGGVGVMLCNVHEKEKHACKMHTPFVPTMRELLANGPFLNYLVSMQAVRLANESRFATIIFMMKIVLRFENLQMAIAGAFLGLTFLMIFTTTLVVTMMRKMGKNESSTTDLT